MEIPAEMEPQRVKAEMFTYTVKLEREEDEIRAAVRRYFRQRHAETCGGTLSLWNGVSYGRDRLALFTGCTCMETVVTSFPAEVTGAA